MTIVTRTRQLDGTIEEVEDHGDGTGTRTTYDDGQVVSTEQVEMPLPDPRELNRAQLLAKVERLVADLDYLRGRIEAGTTAATAIENRAAPTNATVVSDVKMLATIQLEHMDLFGKLADRVVGMARIVVDQLDDPVTDEDAGRPG